MADVTVLLRQWRDGDQGALDQLVPIVYAELRRIAGVHMARERPGSTLSATDLVSEAYQRLSAQATPPEANDRVHFFSIAARYMRQILVERARRRATSKRGGGQYALELDQAIAAEDRPEELVALDEALAQLAAVDERKGRAVEMHYFAGMTFEEIAEVLGISVSTVQRELRFAHAWLQKQLGEP